MSDGKKKSRAKDIFALMDRADEERAPADENIKASSSQAQDIFARMDQAAPAEEAQPVVDENDPQVRDYFSAIDSALSAQAAQAPNERNNSQTNFQLDPMEGFPVQSLASRMGMETTRRPGDGPDNPHYVEHIAGIETLDRVAMGLGNEAGSVKYLKKKFGDAKYDGNTGRISVLDKDGQWKTTDMGGAMPLAVEAVLPTALGIVGSMAGTPLLGGTGGAMLGERANIGAGQMLGTYEGTSDDIAQDMAWSGVMALTFGKIAQEGGAYVKEFGKRPSPQMLRGMVANLFSPATNMAKGGLKKMLGLTQMTKKAVDTIVDSPAEYLKASKRWFPGFRKGAGLFDEVKTIDQVKQAISKENTESVTSLFRGVRKRFQATFQKMEDNLIASPGVDTMVINPKNVIGGLADDLARTGLLKAEFKGDKLVGYVVPDEAAAKRFLIDEGNGSFNHAAYHNLQQYAEGLTNMMNKPMLKGKEAARAALQLRRQLDEFYDVATAKSTTLRKQISEVHGATRKKLVSLFDDKSVGWEAKSLYDDMNKFFIDNYRHVQDAEKIAKSHLPGDATKSVGAQLRGFFNPTKDGDGLTMEAVVRLSGAVGEEVNKRVLANNAVIESMKFLPHARGLFKETGHSVINTLGKAVISPLFSPRMASGAATRLMQSPASMAGAAMSPGFAGKAAEQIPFIKSLRDSLNSMTPDQINGLLESPDILEQAVDGAIHGPEAAEAEAMEMIQQSGVLERQQQ